MRDIVKCFRPRIIDMTCLHGCFIHQATGYENLRSPPHIESEFSLCERSFGDASLPWSKTLTRSNAWIHAHCVSRTIRAEEVQILADLNTLLVIKIEVVMPEAFDVS